MLKWLGRRGRRFWIVVAILALLWLFFGDVIGERLLLLIPDIYIAMRLAVNWSIFANCIGTVVLMIAVFMIVLTTITGKVNKRFDALEQKNKRGGLT